MLIAPEDRIRLPAGIVVDGLALRDPVRAEPIPLNATGRLVAGAADGRTVTAVAAALSAQTGVPPERALADTLAFCAELNRRLLLNVDRSRRRLGRAAVLLAHGLRPGVLRRRGRLRALAAPGAAIGSLGTLLVLPVVPPAGAVLLGLALGAALLVHEAGHAALLRGVPWCVSVAGLKVEILHRPVPRGRRCAVAAAGPVAAALAGGLALAVAWLFAAEELALASAPLTAQALGLTVLAGDGRTACGLS